MEASGVTAVVVLWNSGRVALDLLRSLEGDFARRLRMVIVDNDSGDDSVEVVEGFLAGQPYAERVTLVRSEENSGFTGGVNLGTDVALAANPAPEFIWLLNPDATVVPGALGEFVAVARESGAGIVAAGTGHMRLDGWPRYFFLRPNEYWSNERKGRWWPVSWYSGPCVLFDAALVRKLITETGMFQDPSIFMDWDEWECSLRATRLGAAIVTAADVEFHHDAPIRSIGREPSAHFRQYYSARNGIAVARRHMSRASFWAVLPIHFARDFSWMARLRFRGHRTHPIAYLEGSFDGFRGRMGRWKKHPAASSANR